MGDLDQREQLADLAPDLRLRAPPDRQAEGDVIPDRHVLERRVVLEDEADAALLGGHVRHVTIAESDAALLGDLEAADDPQERRLAAARRAKQGGQGAVADLQRDIVEDDHVPVALGEVADRDRHRYSPIWMVVIGASSLRRRRKRPDW